MKKDDDEEERIITQVKVSVGLWCNALKFDPPARFIRNMFGTMRK